MRQRRSAKDITPYFPEVEPGEYYLFAGRRFKEASSNKLSREVDRMTYTPDRFWRRVNCRSQADIEVVGGGPGLVDASRRT